MTMESGYYRMARGWMDCPTLRPRGGKFSRAEAWLWLIENAAWKERRVDIEGKTVALQRGQLVASFRYLAKAWGWPKTVVERFINRLKTETMIRTETGTGETVITICNYSKYQSNAEAGGTANGTGAGQNRKKVIKKERQTLSFRSPPGSLKSSGESTLPGDRMRIRKSLRALNSTRCSSGASRLR